MSSDDLVRVSHAVAWCNSCRKFVPVDLPSNLAIRIRDLSTTCSCGNIVPIIEGQVDPSTGNYIPDWWKIPPHLPEFIVEPSLIEKLKEERDRVRKSRVVGDTAFELLDLARPGSAEVLRRLPTAMQWPVFLFIVACVLVASGGAGAAAFNSMLDLMERVESSDQIFVSDDISEDEMAEFTRVVQSNPHIAAGIEEILQGAEASRLNPQPAFLVPTLATSPQSGRPRLRQGKSRHRRARQRKSRVECLPADPAGGKRR